MRDSKKNQRKQAYTGGYLKQKKTQPGFVPSAPFFVLGYTCTSKSFTTFAYTGYSTPAYIRMHNGSLYTFVKKVPNPYKYF